VLEKWKIVDEKLLFEESVDIIRPLIVSPDFGTVLAQNIFLLLTANSPYHNYISI